MRPRSSVNWLKNKLIFLHSIAKMQLLQFTIPNGFSNPTIVVAANYVQREAVLALVWPEHFFKLLKFFLWKCGENFWKGPKLWKKYGENSWFFLWVFNFLFLNILDQIFKISTIAGTLDTLSTGTRRVAVECDQSHFWKVWTVFLFIFITLCNYCELFSLKKSGVLRILTSLKSSK